MTYFTRFYTRLNQIINFFDQKFSKLKKNFLSLLLALFIGFFFGNLFGTLIDFIKNLNIPTSLLIFILIIFNEFINFILYNKEIRFESQIHFYFKTKLYNLLNAFKIGVLLGFFIDSFKVGS